MIYLETTSRLYTPYSEGFATLLASKLKRRRYSLLRRLTGGSLEHWSHGRCYSPKEFSPITSVSWPSRYLTQMQISDNSILSTTLSEFIKGGTLVITRKDILYDRSFIQSSRMWGLNSFKMKKFLELLYIPNSIIIYIVFVNRLTNLLFDVITFINFNI